MNKQDDDDETFLCFYYMHHLISLGEKKDRIQDENDDENEDKIIIAIEIIEIPRKKEEERTKKNYVT